LQILDVAAGMLYLHNNGIVHGDLKGVRLFLHRFLRIILVANSQNNILVTKEGRACLADFGLSSVMDSQGPTTSSLSSTSQEGGTPRFQAPELIDPHFQYPRSYASDVYAFAFVSYEVDTSST
jgi:serine/threonine protein kinase